MTLGDFLGKYAGEWLGAVGESDPNAIAGTARGYSLASATLAGGGVIAGEMVGSASGYAVADGTLKPPRVGGGGYTSFYGLPSAMPRNISGRAAGSAYAVAELTAAGILRGSASNVGAASGRLIGVWYPLAQAEDEFWLLAA